MKTNSKMKSLLTLCLAAFAAFIVVASATVFAQSRPAAVDDRYVFTWRTPNDAGMATGTLCPGQGKINTTIDVLCSSRFCYQTTGTAGQTNATVTPIFPNCLTGPFLYDGGFSTTVFNEGIVPGPPARIALGDHSCIAFGALNDGGLQCEVYNVIGNNAQP